MNVLLNFRYLAVNIYLPRKMSSVRPSDTVLHPGDKVPGQLVHAGTGQPPPEAHLDPAQPVHVPGVEAVEADPCHQSLAAGGGLVTSGQIPARGEARGWAGASDV